MQTTTTTVQPPTVAIANASPGTGAGAMQMDRERDPQYQCCNTPPPKIGFIAAGIDIAINGMFLIASVAVSLSAAFQLQRSRYRAGAFGGVFGILVALIFIMGLKRGSPGWILVYAVVKIVLLIIHLIIAILLIVGISLTAQVAQAGRVANTVMTVFGVLIGLLILFVLLDVFFLVVAFKCRRFYANQATVPRQMAVTVTTYGNALAPAGGFHNQTNGVAGYPPSPYYAQAPAQGLPPAYAEVTNTNSPGHPQAAQPSAQSSSIMK